MEEMEHNDLWRGLNAGARKRLVQRDYTAAPIEERISSEGLEAGNVLASERALKEAGVWIPGVELIHRTVYPQRHRGLFSELVRSEEGLLGRIGLWPQQWAAARMYAGSAKGFHVHPPYIPEGETPEAWIEKLYVNDPENFALRPYDREQWDIMFFLQGRLDLILVDERAGLPRRRMRLFLEGDNHRGVNAVSVIIPPGVAHALRSEGTEDLLMVYGTSTRFEPAYEGRIASDVETLPLPEGWGDYLASDSK